MAEGDEIPQSPPTITITPAANANGNKTYSSNYSNYVSGSVGFNVPQILVAGIEASLMGSSMKNAAIVAGAVGVSNLLPAYSGTANWGSSTEKYIAEPILAGVLYSVSGYLIKGDKQKSLLKKFMKGFLIGSSSAAVSGGLYGATMATTRVPSMYSARNDGLRGAVNKPMILPQFIVS